MVSTGLRGENLDEWLAFGRAGNGDGGMAIINANQVTPHLEKLAGAPTPELLTGRFPPYR